jgi:hypothetical protein
VFWENRPQYIAIKEASPKLLEEAVLKFFIYNREVDLKGSA